jgi:hypothetical protein
MSRTTTLASKPTVPDEPRRGFIAVGRRLTWDELYNRPQTAVGFIEPSPWAPFELFEGSSEELQARYQRIQKETEAAEHAQRERARAAARAREAAGPQPVAPVLRGEENCLLRREPMAAETISEQVGDEWRELTSDRHFGLAAHEFFDALGYTNEVLITTTPGGTRRYADAAPLLDAANTVEPNRREMGVAAKRKFLVTEFPGIIRGCKLVAHLKGTAHLTAIIAAGGRDIVQVWWDVSRLTQARLAKFYAETVRIGSPNTTGRADFQAAMPSGKIDGTNIHAARALQAAGVELSGSVPGKNVILYFAPK